MDGFYRELYLFDFIQLIEAKIKSQKAFSLKKVMEFIEVKNRDS